MNQRLRVKECMIALEKAIKIPIIDYYLDFNTIVILIDGKNRFKWRKNKPTVKKISKQIGKHFKYVSLSCSVREAAMQCIYPVKIEDIILKRNNGKTTLIYLIDQCIKDFVLNKYGSKFKLSEILLKHFAIDKIEIKGINSLYYDYHEKLLVSEPIR